jgi:hypothetical protein
MDSYPLVIVISSTIILFGIAIRMRVINRFVRLILKKVLQWYANWSERKYQSLNKPGLNDRLVRTILAKNIDTEYGRSHDFASILAGTKRFEDLPITTYADYKANIDAQTEIPIRYVSTTGTTGIPKKIPVYTELSWPAMPVWEILLMRSYPLDYMGKRLMPFHATARSDYKGISIKNGLTTQLDRMNQSNLVKKLIGGASASTFDVFMLENHNQATFKHIVNAVLNPRIWCIMTYFSKATYHMFRFMELNWENILLEVRTVDTNRYKFLSGLNFSTTKHIGLKIWPGLKVIVCGASGYFKFYKRHIEIYVSDTPVLNIMYASTEGLFGYPTSIGTDEYVLYPIECGMEFMTENKMVPYDELIDNHTYELVITTHSRFYRYRTGDLIKFIRYDGNLPVVTYLQRATDFITVDSESVSVGSLASFDSVGSTVSVLEFEAELVEIGEKCGFEVTDYMFYINTGSVITLYLECSKQSTHFDSICTKYRFNLCYVRPDTFMTLSEIMAGRIALPDQVKIPRICQNNDFIHDYLIENILYEEV